MCDCFTAVKEAKEKPDRECDETAAPCPLAEKKELTNVQVVSIEYLTDHKLMLDKHDDWRDPVSPVEKKRIKDYGPEFVRGQNGGKARPVTHTWDQKVSIKVVVKVDPIDCVPEKGVIEGKSSLPHLSFRSAEAEFSGGVMTIPSALVAQKPLPKKVDLVENVTVKWSAKTDQTTISDSGTSIHEVYVTTGAPVMADSWPMESNRGDHNFPTAFRVKHAVKTARRENDPHAMVRRIWQSYGGEYDLSAPGDLNPWNLAASGTRAQCMTICSFMQSAAGLLGLRGQVVYVWPNFAEPTGAETTKSYNARAEAWAAASPRFQSQKRSIKSPPHSPQTKHNQYGSIEQVALVDHATNTATGDWIPGWNNYEATFRFEDGGVTKYYGGGGPIEDSPKAVLDKVCAVITWCYSTSASVKTFCSPPGPCKWWGKPRTPWPPPTMDSEMLRG